MLDDDDELTDLLADENRVRDALLAAVDVQQVPPVHTDLGEIVRRGRRRARLQVVSASMAAVVLIGAVALGATLIGRLGAPDRTSAAGQGTSLPMTSQTLSTTSNPPPSDADRDFYGPDAPCIFPALAGQAKWVPLSADKASVFVSRTMTEQPGSAEQVTPAVAAELDEVGQAASRSIEIDWRGQQTLVTVSASVYGGPAGMAVAQDMKSQQLPPDCAGTSSTHQINKTMLVVEYPEVTSNPTGPTYLRVRLYAQDGVRYDVTEAVNAASYVSPSAPVSGPTATGRRASGTASTGTASTGASSNGASSSTGLPVGKILPGVGWPPALTMTQLLDVAIGVASAP